MKTKDIKVGSSYQVARPVFVKGLKIRVEIETRVCDRIDTSGKSPMFTMRNPENGKSADVYAKDVVSKA